jgi:hypothetical protein
MDDLIVDDAGPFPSIENTSLQICVKGTATYATLAGDFCIGSCSTVGTLPF